MIAIRPNFFYTRTVPCELWFFDRNKPKVLHNKVLMIDARNIYRKVTRKIFDFSPEQLANLTAIVWMYRGRKDRFLALVADYLSKVYQECDALAGVLNPFDEALCALRAPLDAFVKVVAVNGDVDAAKRRQLAETLSGWTQAAKGYVADRKKLMAVVDAWKKKFAKVPIDNSGQRAAREAFEPIAEELKGQARQAAFLFKLATRASEIAEKELGAKGNGDWDGRLVNRRKKDLDTARRDAIEQMKQAAYFHKQVAWLHHRFPEGKLADVPGLVKLIDRKEIESNDWSLTPGRYVGVAPPAVDEDFDFEEALRDIHTELANLNQEASELAAKIQTNFEGLGG
jgi:type I restriction enzyme M protein